MFAVRYRDATGRFERGRLWFEGVTGVLTGAPHEHLCATLQDLRYALRRLRLSPGFAVTSIATLALAIGVSTAMFSVLNAVLLRELPFRSADQLAMLWREIPSQAVREGRSSYRTVEEWRSQSRSFADLALFDPVSATLSYAGDSQQVSVLRVSPNLFALLGVVPIHGRTFSAEEAEQRQRLAVISHRLWRSRLGGSLNAIGASLTLDGQSSQIIGILPDTIAHAGFDADVWEADALFPDWRARRGVAGAPSWFVIGRLQPNVRLEQAQAEMTTVGRIEQGGGPIAPDRTTRVMPFSHHVTGSQPRLVVRLLTAAASLLLMVAAANVAGLSLARGAARVPEMAIRAALGAGQSRIVRLLLAESLTIAAIAGLLGLLLAAAGIRVIRLVNPANLARLQEITLDVRVFLWASSVTLLAGLIVGLAPAAAIRRRDLRSAGAEGGRGIAGGTAAKLRRVLVVAECAVAIILLAGGGLLVRSWWNVMDVDPGFRSERVLSMSVATPAAMENAQRPAFFNLLLERVAALPGVERAGIASELFVGNVAQQVISADGSDGTASHTLQVRRDEVTPDFFATLGTPLRRGRFFSAADGPDAAPVAIINEAMANRVWPGLDPVGRRLTIGAAGASFTVVGVVGNMRRQSLETEPVAQIFESLAQNPSRRAILFVRTSTADPLQLAGTLRAAVASVDAGALAYSVTTVDERLGAMVAQRRWQTALLAGFSGAALMLATIGLYSLIQYSVASRTREIGLRMALGARPADIFRMFIRDGLVLSLAGMAIGLGGALWLSRLASSLLFGVSATDPLTFSAVSMLLITVAVVACCIPARRAMAVPPVVALQQPVL